MDEMPKSPKIARAQAMDFAFNLSGGEMMLLFPTFPTTTEGREWNKRPREQQKAAMLWVLNRLFFASVGGLPIGDRDPQTRRALVLDWCHGRVSLLQENCSWSMHDVMDWLVEVKAVRCWTEHHYDFDCLKSDS